MIFRETSAQSTAQKILRILFLKVIFTLFSFQIKRLLFSFNRLKSEFFAQNQSHSVSVRCINILNIDNEKAK